MEAQGSGVHIVMTAKTALALGCPIRGILAFTSTSTDKAGRSIPAPGRGALTVAREISSEHPVQLLDISYRARQLAFRKKQISHWMECETKYLKEGEASVDCKCNEHVLTLRLDFEQSKQGMEQDDRKLKSRIADIEAEAKHQERDALSMYGMLEGSDPRISPMRRALAVWGLTADDIGVLSIHGTSTGANVDYFFR